MVVSFLSLERLCHSRQGEVGRVSALQIDLALERAKVFRAQRATGFRSAVQSQKPSKP
jgi:hypothetical protein